MQGRSVRELRSYIIRIYRQGFEHLWGTAEDPGTGQRYPFSTAEQLWQLLQAPVRKRGRQVQIKKGAKPWLKGER